MLLAAGEGHLLFMHSDSPVLAPIREFLTAETLDAAPVWRDGIVVSDDDLKAAMPSARAQAQPWGAIGALKRRRWLKAASA
jgi:hypothetical protein